MATEADIRRYRTFDPDLLQEEEPAEGSELDGGSPLDQAVRYLTWGILSVCLALWAVVGFVFWVPLLLRSMIQFSFALSQSMLQGTQPVEAGRILRDTVGFYRRGFTVAINAVFGPPPRKKEEQVTHLTVKDLLFEIVWAVLVWYGILFLIGVISASPVDLWNAVIGLPWGEWWLSLQETVSGWLGGGADTGGADLGVDPVSSGGSQSPVQGTAPSG